MKEIATQPYSKILDDYTATIEWMERLGVKIGSGRAAQYAKEFAWIEENYQTAPQDQVRFPSFINTTFEIYELVAIYHALKNLEMEEAKFLVTKLQKTVNGPIDRTCENENTSVARNFLFELAVAARNHQPAKQLSVIANAKSDVGIRYNKNKILVECKRITNPEAIEKHVKKAAKQLDGELKKQLGSSKFGLVAIDISKLFTNGGDLYVAGNDDVLSRGSSELMNSFINQYNHTWQRVLAKHPKILGVIVRFSFMGMSEERNLPVYVSEWAINPRDGISLNHQDMLKRLVHDIKSAQ